MAKKKDCPNSEPILRLFNFMSEEEKNILKLRWCIGGDGEKSGLDGRRSMISAPDKGEMAQRLKIVLKDVDPLLKRAYCRLGELVMEKLHDIIIW
jgi:hypothetical protein